MDTKVLSRYMRIGNISSVNEGAMSARVTFPDMDNTVSAELPILCQGSQNRKYYWLPDIGEQVVCLMMPNASGKGSNAGFIIGTFFNQKDKPIKTGANIRRGDFGDGSFIEHDKATGNITIHATGKVTITGTTINLN